MSVLYLTSDLFFSSRVTGAARQSGIEISVVGSIEQLRDRLSDSTVAVLVDLEHRAASDPGSIVALVQSGTQRPRTIAYGPHVKTTLLEAAQAAGFDLVVSRGEFDKQIGTFLQSLNQS